MASNWYKSLKSRFKRDSNETGKDPSDKQESLPEQPQPALSQADLIRILKIIKKYDQGEK